VSLNNDDLIERLLAEPQYSLGAPAKSALLLEELRRLTARHRSHCEPYRMILDGLGNVDAPAITALDRIPFLPVRLFKTIKLQSVPDSEVLKVLTSSGTTSQQVARIAVDKETSMLQTKSLASIVTSFIGPKRLPMIIVDSAAILRDRASLSARGAGLVGFSNFGRDHFYALDEQMHLNLAGLMEFVKRHGHEQILIFGFTFMVWQYFYGELRRVGEQLSLNRAVLIHSGGWKKLQDQKVSHEKFKEELQRQCGIRRVHNFYGMVEQVGGIYMECEHGYFHAPNTAEIFIRDHRDWSLLPAGRPGLVQTLSVLPRSYPGHSLLTEDWGQVHGTDDCPCGRQGTYFRVHGRIPQAELRGCSDTHASEMTVKTATPAGIRQFIPRQRECGSIEEILPKEFFEQVPLPSFLPLAIDFLSALSQGIFNHTDARQYPDLMALGFWLRKSNIQTVANDFLKTVAGDELVMARGVAFHVAPSNVDTIFVYSWALSLLAGNLNIVRISQIMNPQLRLLMEILQQVVTESRWLEIARRNHILTYPRSETASVYLSANADVRMLWGGDVTINTLRSLPSKTTTKDIVFADKFSYALVPARRYLELDARAMDEGAHHFYNDAYQFGQMACSSPHIVFFSGDDDTCVQASNRFWVALGAEVQRRQSEDPPAIATDKLVFAFQSLTFDGTARLVSGHGSSAPTVVRIQSAQVSSSRTPCGGGFFFECFVRTPEDIAVQVKNSDQTLSYLCFSHDEARQLGRLLCTNGIERIVPVGQALTFTTVWDGYVLMSELTRRISVK